MNYPLAETIARQAPLSEVTMVDPTPLELYDVTEMIPDMEGIRDALVDGGYTNRIPHGALDAAVAVVQERLDGTQGRQGFAPAC